MGEIEATKTSTSHLLNYNVNDKSSAKSYPFTQKTSTTSLTHRDQSRAFAWIKRFLRYKKPPTAKANTPPIRRIQNTVPSQLDFSEPCLSGQV
jgi:hypothetical protein